MQIGVFCIHLRVMSLFFPHFQAVSFNGMFSCMMSEVFHFPSWVKVHDAVGHREVCSAAALLLIDFINLFLRAGAAGLILKQQAAFGEEGTIPVNPLQSHSQSRRCCCVPWAAWKSKTEINASSCKPRHEACGDAVSPVCITGLCLVHRADWNLGMLQCF